MNPDFSVMMITYNHEKFIEEAVESIIRQDFTGSVEIVLGVDKSTDSTLTVCERLAEKYENIKLVVHEQSAGMFGNFFQALFNCTGKYIAILEGDDFWTDRQKLSKQFAYLETHSNCIITAGSVSDVDEHSRPVGERKKAKELRVSKDELMLANRYPTLTVAFRKDRINWEKLNTLAGSPHLDWPFFVSLNYGSGDYGFRFAEEFGAYRYHGGGLYSTVGAEKKLLNTAKTVFWIAKMEGANPEAASYLRRLFCNLLKEKGKEMESPFREFFDPELVIYRGSWLRLSFLVSCTKTSLQYLFNKRRRFAFRGQLELVRQTRISNKNYFQLAINPIIVLGFIRSRVT